MATLMVAEVGTAARTAPGRGSCRRIAEGAALLDSHMLSQR